MMERHDDIMNREIEARMQSDLWDRGVARSVLRRRRGKRFGAIAAGAAASMAAAAMLFVVVLPGIRGGLDEGKALDGFVKAQVEGTWTTVFNGELANGTAESMSLDDRYDEGLETMITDTLAMRL